jgi:hypothetical protein
MGELCLQGRGSAPTRVAAATNGNTVVTFMLVE